MLKQYLMEFMESFEFSKEDKQVIEKAFDSLEASSEAYQEFLQFLKTYDEDIKCDFTSMRLRMIEVSVKAGIHEYTGFLILFICLSKSLKRYYQEAGYSEEIWFTSMCDLKYKLDECKEVYGIAGTFVPEWYPRFYSLGRFGFGKLQFEIVPFKREYAKNGVVLKPDSRVINVHIPRTGTKLDRDSMKASYKMAAEFYKEILGEEPVVFVCHSWLLYPRNKEVLSEKSNLYAFISDFDIVEVELYEDYKEVWRLFDVQYDGNVDHLPQNTSLRRAYAEWIRKGEKTGCGYGVYVYKEDILANFELEGTVISQVPFGNGHINDTFLVTLRKENGTEDCVILQKMNRSIFTRPVEVMENIMGVTSFLREKIIANGGDPERETLTVIPAKNGEPYFVDLEGEYWRCFALIKDATSFDQVETVEDFYESAVAFGNFQRLLADYPAETLHETIVGFHDTKARFEVFKNAVEADICGRADSVKQEIEFVLAHEDVANVFGDLLAKGEIPLRVTHNDTKLNNVMIDNKTHKGICVIDLDTVMPGLAMNDFGDSVRFGASTAAEDEKDLDKVWCDMELFEVYTKGFIEGCGGKLTQKEIELLPMGAKVMTFECGMRFLTDYLQGDTYFKVHREGHNLDRCRTQFKLVSDMETKWETMNEIVKKYI